MIGNGLAYLSVVVRDVAAVAEMLHRDFKLEASMVTVGSGGNRAPVFPMGDTAIALFEVGDPFVGGAERTGVHHLAVEVDFPVSAALTAGEAGIPMLSDTMEWGLGGTQRILLDPKATGGVVTYLSEPLTLARQEPEVVERIDHIGVASDDNDLVRDVFTNKLGWELESSQTDTEVAQSLETFTSDKYGVTYRSKGAQLVGGVRVSFITIGDCELELLQNLNPPNSNPESNPNSNQGVGRAAPGPGSTRQDQNVIDRFIQSRGPGLHHLALKVRDINRQLSRLESAGYTLIDTQGRPGSRLAQIGFVHPASLGGLLIHLVQRNDVP